MKDEKKRLPGRPPKEGFTYFSIDCDFFEKDEIKALRRACGEIGVLTYLNILSRVFGTHGYYYVCESIDVLAEDIAEQITNDRIKRKAARVRETITHLVSRDIIDSTLAEQSVISGIEMQERYIEMAYRSRRKINMDVHKLVDVDLVIQKIRDSAEETRIFAEENAVNAEETQQSKKVNYKHTTTTFRSMSRTRVNDKEERGDPPQLSEVFAYLSSECYLPDGADAFKEADKFVAYNANRGWDCLPDWKSAVNLWVSRI